MTNTWLKQIFRNDGKIVDVYISNKARANKNFKFNFIRFAKREEAIRAMQRNNGLEVNGH